jgi:hypothetical protein
MQAEKPIAATLQADSDQIAAGRVRRNMDAGDREGTRQPFEFYQRRFQVLERGLEEPRPNAWMSVC